MLVKNCDFPIKDGDFPVRKLLIYQFRVTSQEFLGKFPRFHGSHSQNINGRGARSPRRRPTSLAPQPGPGDASGSDASADLRSQGGGHPPGFREVPRDEVRRKIHGKPMGKNIGHREHRGKIWNIPDLAMEVYIDRWEFFLYQCCGYGFCIARFEYRRLILEFPR